MIYQRKRIYQLHYVSMGFEKSCFPTFLKSKDVHLPTSVNRKVLPTMTRHIVWSVPYERSRPEMYKVILSGSVKCRKLNIYYVANDKTATFVSFFSSKYIVLVQRKENKLFEDSHIQYNKCMSRDDIDSCKTWTPSCQAII